MDINGIIGELIADPRYTYADHQLIADVAREVYAALTPGWTVQPTLTEFLDAPHLPPMQPPAGLSGEALDRWAAVIEADTARMFGGEA